MQPPLPQWVTDAARLARARAVLMDWAASMPTGCQPVVDACALAYSLRAVQLGLETMTVDEHGQAIGRIRAAMGAAP